MLVVALQQFSQRRDIGLIAYLHQCPGGSLLHIEVSIAELLQQDLLGRKVETYFQIPDNIVFGRILGFASDPVQDVYLQFRFGFRNHFHQFDIQFLIDKVRRVAQSRVPVVLARIFHGGDDHLRYFGRFFGCQKYLQGSFPCLFLSGFYCIFLQFLGRFHHRIPVARNQLFQQCDIGFVGTGHFHRVAGLLGCFRQNRHRIKTADTAQGVQDIFLHIRIGCSLQGQQDSFRLFHLSIGNRTDHILLCFGRTRTALQGCNQSLSGLFAAVGSQCAGSRTAQRLIIQVRSQCIYAFVFSQNLKLADNECFCFALVHHFQSFQISIGSH